MVEDAPPGAHRGGSAFVLPPCAARLLHPVPVLVSALDARSVARVPGRGRLPQQHRRRRPPHGVQGGRHATGHSLRPALTATPRFILTACTLGCIVAATSSGCPQGAG